MSGAEPRCCGCGFARGPARHAAGEAAELVRGMVPLHERDPLTRWICDECVRIAVTHFALVVASRTPHHDDPPRLA